MSYEHTLRPQYVVLIFSNLILAAGVNVNPVEFGWNSVDSELMPNIYWASILNLLNSNQITLS